MLVMMLFGLKEILLFFFGEEMDSVLGWLVRNFFNFVFILNFREGNRFFFFDVKFRIFFDFKNLFFFYVLRVFRY